ncbi:MAG: hypothetical protein AABZ39_05480 [Spirochaetota bacterium]
MPNETVPQPPMSEWEFIDDLKTPLHSRINWKRNKPASGEADLSGGVTLSFEFPDHSDSLRTAYDDFRSFLKAGNIDTNGRYRINVEKAPTACLEAYTLDASMDSCRISVNDTEGIRRALVFLEDEIMRTGGPFLALGRRERTPVIRTRISRCFFGPIKRPPMNRDELADDVDYYPDEYLNRLSHEGINALWLTIKFKELCPSRFFPEFGIGRERRLEKLRRTVAQCARYGIKIYPFCIEPQGFGPAPEYNHPLSYVEGNDWLKGHTKYFTYFCTSTKDGQAFLEESTFYLFSQVPGLGGLIDINLGERPTHCYSATDNFTHNNCPVCSKRKPWEVFADTTSALARGMQRAEPNTEMISWLYVPYMENMAETKAFIRDIAAHVPKNVTLQYNFESAGAVEQLGKERIALDYWLAWPGPSDIFTDSAKNAVAAGARMSAKIQVGCSHEVATIPFIPVPGNLYKKYKAMHELGVSTVMQCWYFGNYPGLMNKAAGELSFAPFYGSEDDFLRSLASADWPGHADDVVKAWKYFQEGYSNFPVNLPFTWYGPVHNSIVWPLHLIPVDEPIAPSWKFTYPDDSGDRIGECISFGHTLDEVLVLLGRMDENWQKGLAILRSLRADYADEAARLLDIGLAEAIGLQIRSAHNVYRFYDMRERLPLMAKDGQLKTLYDMRAIVEEEIANAGTMIALCRADSRLGFHSEAEGYKYFPAKLTWRIERLRTLLQNDFPQVEKIITNGTDLFPEYTGKNPLGKVYSSGIGGSAWEPFAVGNGRWKAHHDNETLTISVETNIAAGNVFVEIEPRRLWPVMKFEARPDGTKKHHNKLPIEDTRWSVSVECVDGRMVAQFTIPFAVFREKYITRPLRCNVYSAGAAHAWLEKHPLPGRLFFGDDSPKDLGWVIFR